MTTSALARGLRSIALWFINLLPGSPFVFLEQTGAIYKFLRWLNWIVPVQWILATLATWLLAVQLYQLLQVGLRWFKVIE